MKKEYCGLFGISGHAEAARMTYFGLYAMQHRGQESAGIVTWDGQKLREQRGMGLVADVFREEHLSRQLKGTVGMGHIRYSTTGASLLRNAQPFMVRYKDMGLAVAHNGNLVNTVELRRELENNGSLFQTSMDSEIVMHLVAQTLSDSSLEEAMSTACRRLKGAYSLLFMANNKLIGLRDPWGFRPLCLGRVGDAYVLASETCAFDLLEAEYLRDIEPGEMVVIENGRLHSYRFCEPERTSPCIFELIYFARPDSIVFGKNVYESRKAMGRTLAREAPVDADFVMPFPDSGVYAAVGYAQESGLPYEMAMIRNHYVGRTFIQPSQDMRDFGVRVKLNPVKSMINGKRIVIVEDSVVRGTTIRTRVKKLRELGARELHLRVSCPPICHPCYYGIDFSSKGELIAANHSVEDIARYMNLDSLHYLSVDGLLDSVQAKSEYCLACFQGTYPVPPPQGGSKSCLE
ncbi:amidophosphoribosyltransferase [Desulfohalobium retbaense]|uniref:amidophosphoribosyltransferase n=1 Tax=Desulfohalobium retbaense TaxID=45663 RepID=UPI00019B479F|nr:amidophosphoribosyltransferase [Desulfohalobium retbaense]